MTDLASEEDIHLFRLFAAQETRRIMEALLEGPLQQKDLAKELGVTPQAVSPAIKRLEAAGIAERASARGLVYLKHHDATARLLEMEARLFAEIQDERAKRSARRLRELRKRGMKRRALEGEAADSA